MRAEVVDHAPSFLAIDHVGIKAPEAAGAKCPNPSHRFTAQGIEIAIVFDLEGNILAAFWKHDAPPGADVEEGQRIQRSMPDLLHNSRPNGGQPVLARKSE